MSGVLRSFLRDLHGSQYMGRDALGAHTVTRFPVMRVVIAALLLTTAEAVQAADWALIERYPELADYLGYDNFREAADAMKAGSHWARPKIQDLPDYQDAHVDFAGGD